LPNLNARLKPIKSLLIPSQRRLQYISQFIERLVRPHIIETDLESGYRRMALDEAHEFEALEWAEATIGDVCAL
jgi:hypothetical protein